MSIRTMKNKVQLILGNITFHHFTDEELKLFKTDNEQKALVHCVDEVLFFDTLEQVYEIVDNTDVPSWLIPSEYNGEIIYEESLVG